MFEPLSGLQFLEDPALPRMVFDRSLAHENIECTSVAGDTRWRLI
jgi:hypothetical protein